MGSVKTTYRVLKPLKTGGRNYGRGELIPAAEGWGMAILEQRLRTHVVEKAFVSEEEYNLALGVETPDEEPVVVAPVVETQQNEDKEPAVDGSAAGSTEIDPSKDFDSALVEEEIDDEFEDADDEADDEISVEEIEEEDSDEETDDDAPVVTGARRKIKRKRDV